MNFKNTFLLLCMGALFMWAACSDKSGPAPVPPVTIGGGGQNPSPNASSSEEYTGPKPSIQFPEGAVASTTRNFYFVFDGSGSMDGKLDDAKRAVRAFMQHVPTDVNLGLFVFDSHGCQEVLPLGPGQRDAFLAKVEAIRAGGTTPLGSSIMTGCNALLRQYERQLGYGGYRLVVVTDGKPDSESDFRQACEYAVLAGVPIYAIGYLVPGGDHPLRDKRFTVSYREATDRSSLEQGLKEVLAETETFDPTSFEELLKQKGTQGK